MLDALGLSDAVSNLSTIPLEETFFASSTPNMLPRPSLPSDRIGMAVATTLRASLRFFISPPAPSRL